MTQKDLNQYNEEEMKGMDVIFSTQPLLRQYFIQILILIAIGLYSMILYKKVPENGIWLNEIVHLNWKIFHKLIPFSYLTLPLKVITFLCFFRIVFLQLKQYTTTYSLNDIDLIIKKGILTTQDDQTPLTDIDDFFKRRNILERILGLATIQIFSKKDKTDPLLIIKGLHHEDAEGMINFFRKYNFKSITEYRMAQEKQQRRRAALKRNAHSIDDSEFEEDLDINDNHHHDKQ